MTLTVKKKVGPCHARHGPRACSGPRAPAQPALAPSSSPNGLTPLPTCVALSHGTASAAAPPPRRTASLTHYLLASSPSRIRASSPSCTTSAPPRRAVSSPHRLLRSSLTLNAGMRRAASHHSIPPPLWFSISLCCSSPRRPRGRAAFSLSASCLPSTFRSLCLRLSLSIRAGTAAPPLPQRRRRLHCSASSACGPDGPYRTDRTRAILGTAHRAELTHVPK